VVVPWLMTNTSASLTTVATGSSEILMSAIISSGQPKQVLEQ